MKRLALLLLAFTGLMSACSKDDPVPQDGSLTPDSPEGREAVTIPDEFLRTYLLKYFDFDRNGELSRYEASLVVRIDCPGNINAGEGAYMCDATGIEACTNLRYLNLSGNDLTKLDVRQQQTARYARLFNQYSSEKFTCRKTRISCNCIVMPVLLKLRDGTYLRIRN